MTKNQKTTFEAHVRVKTFMMLSFVYTTADQMATLYTLYVSKDEKVHAFDDKSFIADNAHVCYVAKDLIQKVKWMKFLKNFKANTENATIMNEIDRLTK